MTHKTMTNSKEVFYSVTAEWYGGSVMLTQDNGQDEPDGVVLHPIQLRHIAERFAGLEPAARLNQEPVKTLARRLRTLAFHIDFLYDYIKNHSDHRHADLTYELCKVTALSELADEFCNDLPDEDDEATSEADMTASTIRSDAGEKPGQPSLI